MLSPYKTLQCLRCVTEDINSSGKAGDVGDPVCGRAQARLLGNQAKQGNQKQSGLE